jgi:hypothetical protein
VGVAVAVAVDVDVDVTTRVAAPKGAEVPVGVTVSRAKPGEASAAWPPGIPESLIPFRWSRDGRAVAVARGPG